MPCFLLGNLLSPAHLDWDTLLEPSYLFSPSPATERGQGEGSATWPPLRCQAVIHALCAGKPVSWEVSTALDSLLLAKESQSKEEQQLQSKAWGKLIHRLTAGSVIRDNENMAQREAELEHGERTCFLWLHQSLGGLPVAGNWVGSGHYPQSELQTVMPSLHQC